MREERDVYKRQVIEELGDPWAIAKNIITSEEDVYKRQVLMKDGKIIGDDIPKKIFADYELLKKAKMDIPPVVEFGRRLEKQQIRLECPV